ncbi:MAG TPA: LPS export ABC transporter periplasmic protein LptC, partial [Limnochordales bacterium]
MGWKQALKKRRRAAAALLVAALVAAVAWGTLRREEQPPAQTPAPEETRPQLVSTRVVGRRQGDRQFELEAGAIADEGEWVRIDAIQHGVLYRDGAVFVTFTAKAGRWHRQSNDLVLTGDVALVYEDRVRLYSDRLEWRAEEERVVSPGPVMLTVDGDVIRAASMEADLDEEVVRLRGDVRIERAGGGRIQ